MSVKKKSKKIALKKSFKKAAVAPVKKKTAPSAKKKKVLSVARARKAPQDFLRFEELRDVVERLPEIPLPGAPKELPKDLPEENPAREPALIPSADIFEGGARAAKPPEDAEKSNLPKSLANIAKTRKGHGVWIAVAATFSVIVVVWLGTLGGIFIFPKETDTKFEQEMRALSAEWQGAAETMKEALEAVSSRIRTAAVPDGANPSEEVLRAIGARVIFEAAQAASGTDKK